MIEKRGPLKLRIESEDAEGELLARALREGIVLAEEGEEADLVAFPARGSPYFEGADDEDVVDLGPRQAFSPEATAEAIPPRELEVLEYLADGWSNAEIASVMGIGVRTVRFHLENLYAKLGVSRRGEAVREALRLGIIRMEF